jgi:hypothetical protein
MTPSLHPGLAPLSGSCRAAPQLAAAKHPSSVLAAEDSRPSSTRFGKSTSNHYADRPPSPVASALASALIEKTEPQWHRTIATELEKRLLRMHF